MGECGEAGANESNGPREGGLQVEGEVQREGCGW